jgi:hypothetical protein
MAESTASGALIGMGSDLTSMSTPQPEITAASNTSPDTSPSTTDTSSTSDTSDTSATSTPPERISLGDINLWVSRNLNGGNCRCPALVVTAEDKLVMSCNYHHAICEVHWSLQLPPQVGI